MRKRVKCQKCSQFFFSPVKKTYVIIAYRKRGKEEARVVKGASLLRDKGEKRRAKLEKELCPKEYDKVILEKQLTVKNLLCQGCRNEMAKLRNRQMNQQVIKKRDENSGVVRVIPDEDIKKQMRGQVWQQTIQDYRKKRQEEQRQKMIEQEKQKRKREKKLQRGMKTFKEMEAKKRLSEEAVKNAKKEEPVGEDKPTPA